MTDKHRTEYVITNDVSVETTKAAKKGWWLPLEDRAVSTGVAKCQARKGRKQRNHICIAFVVWRQLNELAKQMKTTLYEVKHKPLREYQKELLRNPAYKFDVSLLGDFA
ncbi:MAG TPA: hypothetical protein VMR45_04900 [Patescibacteria group bacterium]|nr:hypothetical protein [Patescibacteria group bacterium]